MYQCAMMVYVLEIQIISQFAGMVVLLFGAARIFRPLWLSHQMPPASNAINVSVLELKTCSMRKRCILKMSLHLLLG